MPETKPDVASPWYRQSVMWLVIALPAIALCAGLLALVLAIRGADPVVPHADSAASTRPQ
jgi:hypothetical protein